LRASPAFTAAAAAPEGPVAHADAPLALAGGTAPPPPIDPVADTSARKLSFQDVLPRLAALGADAPFVDELVKVPFSLFNPHVVLTRRARRWSASSKILKTSSGWTAWTWSSGRRRACARSGPSALRLFTCRALLIARRAKLVGSAAGLLSPFEAGQLHAAFAKELAAFDRATVLPALDGLRARQRAQLARLGVPGIAAADDEVSGARRGS
jgi:hypothetical protein